jgi:hypothetical protein
VKLPDSPEEDQGPKSNSVEISKAGEQSKRNPGVVVYRGMTIHRPGEAGRQPASRPVGKPVPRPFPWSNQGVSRRTGKEVNPGRRLHAFEAAAKIARPARVPWRYRLRPNRELTRRAYWDVAATFSLIVNAILIGVLLVMAGQIRNLKMTMDGVLGGLYGDLVKMDQASIKTNIMVNAQIPLNFNLPVSQNTETVLTRDVSIPNAHLVIETGILKINAQANVMIPAGTNLPIAMNMDIPVRSMIPVNLQVPVNIPLSQTELHEPLTGFQTSLRPLYCMLNKNAQYPQEIYICAEHDAPKTGTP